MEHAIKHGLSHDQAKAAAKSAADAYAQKLAKYSPTLAWQGDSKLSVAFTAKGISLQGQLSIEPDRYVISMDVPFLLRPFKSMAMPLIEKEAQTWIAKAKAGQL
jgi:hypothetical protein